MGLRNRIQGIKRRFYLSVYKWSGDKVGTDVEDYWDKHWHNTVKARISEIIDDPSRGRPFLRFLFMSDEHVAVDSDTRDYRDANREIRDAR